MTNKPEKTAPESTSEEWESGVLGREEEYVEVVKLDEAEVDKGLDLQLISIRLQKSLIEDFKLIAGMHGLGYQPLMRQVLNRFAEAEKKQLLRQISQKLQEEAKDEAEKETAGKKTALG